MIPKVIHYCWFGKNEMPEKNKKCIESWKKIMPDYEIIEWNEDNYDITKCPYIKEAYDAKKWAFVSDYARLDICYNYGGIYLDTDVEVIKRFDDLLFLEGFCGFEIGKNNVSNEVNTGLVLGMKKGLEIGKILLNDYRNRHFKIDVDKLDLIPCPVIQTETLKKYGLKLNNSKQCIKGLSIFPAEYFCPMNQYTGKTIVTNKTYSIHHYSASWFLPADQYRRELRMKYSRYGNFLSNLLSTVIAYKKYYGIVGMWGKILSKLKK